MLTAQSLFDLTEFPHRDLFKAGEYVWSALTDLKKYMDSQEYPVLNRAVLPDGRPLPTNVIFHDGTFSDDLGCEISFGDATKEQLVVRRNGKKLEGASVLMAGSIIMGNRFLPGKGVLIEPGALIKSPTIVGDYCEVRQAAYLRGYCLAGKRCVLGHATEIKHSIFLNDAKAGHFAYLGDSILGTNANLGAGTKFANLRFIGGNITIMHDEQRIDTGMRKFGAILGDNCQTGCNSVTNPGTIFGRYSMLMPNTTAPAGFHPAKSLIRK